MTPTLPDNPTEAQLRKWLREMEEGDRYFLKLDLDGAAWTEVDRAGFAAAERKAGFHSAYGYDLATAGFSGSGVRGCVIGPEHWDNQYIDADLKAQFGPQTSPADD